MKFYVILSTYSPKNSIFVFEFCSFQTVVSAKLLGRNNVRKQIVTNIVHLNATILYIF